MALQTGETHTHTHTHTHTLAERVRDKSRAVRLLDVSPWLGYRIKIIGQLGDEVTYLAETVRSPRLSLVLIS